MTYIDLLPSNNFEKKYFQAIAYNIPNATVISKNFGDPLPNIEGDKIILMNADEAYRIPEEVNDPSVKLICKQYCIEGQHPKLYPIPLGPSKDLMIRQIPINERAFDVTFIGQIGANRANIYSALPFFLNDSDIKCFFGIYQGFNNGIDSESYSKILANTKVALCPHGTSSPETFRFFEAMKLSCVVLAPQMPNNWIYKDSPHMTITTNVYQDVKNILRVNDLTGFSNASTAYYEKFVNPVRVAERITELLNAQ